MDVITKNTSMGSFKKTLYGFKILSILVFMISGVGVAQANLTIWESMALGYTQNNQAASCNACHNDVKTSSLTMTVPNTVPFDADEIELNLSGVRSGSNFKYWRYQVTGGEGDLLTNVSNSTSETIDFDTSDSQITVRSCLLDAAGSTDRRWNCESKTVTRDAEPNQAPQLSSTTPTNQNVETGDTPFAFTVTATDDKSGVALSVTSSNPSAVAVNSTNSPNFSLSFVSAGSSTITIRARDSDNLVATQSFQVTVTEPPPPPPTNVRPVVALSNSADSAIALTVGDSFTVGVSISDEELASLVYETSSTNTNVATASFSAPGTLSVEAIGEGTTSITLLVRDEGELSSSVSVNVTVTSIPAANLRPVVALSNSGQSSIALTIGDSIDVGVNISDEELASLVYETSSTNTNVATASFSAPGTLSVEAIGEGTTSITLLVRDEGELSSSVSVNVTVTSTPAANLRPVVALSNSGQSAIALTIGESIDVGVSISDEELGSLVYETSSTNTNVATASFSAPGTLSVEAIGEGTTSITLLVRDEQELSSSVSVNVTVTSTPAANLRPVVALSNSGQSAIALTIGESIDVGVSISDESLESLVYETSSNNTDVATVSFSAPGTLNIQAIAEGTTSIILLVRDEKEESSSLSVNVTVASIRPDNLAPSVALTDSSHSAIALTIGDSLAVGVSVSDESIESLAYEISSNNSNVATASFTAPGTLNIEAIGAGTTTINLLVRDELEASASLEVEVSVTISNAAPVATADAVVINLIQGASVEIDVLSNDSDGNGDALVIVLDSERSSQGNLLTVSANRVTYQADAALATNDNFSYRAQDTSGAQSDSVVVSLIPSDQDGDGSVDVVDNCPELPNADQADMDTDQIGDLCDIDPDGDGSPGISGIAFESGRTLVEGECLTCHLTGAGGAPLFNDDDAWNARILAAGGSTEDLLESVLNGLGSMPAYSNVYSTQELLQAVRYLSGVEDLGTSPPDAIVDTDLDGVADEVDNCPSVPNLDQLNSDGTGEGDACEPTADRDGDGIPFSLDDDDSNANRLVATLPITTNSTVFTSANALNLGSVATAVAESNGFTQIAVVLSEGVFAQTISQLFPGVTVETDAQYSTLMGVISLGATSASGQVEVLIRLSSNLPLNPVIRLFDTNSGLWVDFSADASNLFASAPATASGCPISTSANYQAGLTAGLQCVRLNVQDGGANDADGTINGEVELMINIARKALVNDGPAVVILNPSSGGGAAGLWMLLVLLMTRLTNGSSRSLRNRG